MFKRTKAACYSGAVSMAVILNFPPLVFITFKDYYGISYSQLGLLVLINFLTQLGMDLIFTFLSHKFNIALTVRTIPVISTVGFVLYALSPFIFPGSVLVGLILGTVIFSAAGGLIEVLMSPVIAAIPSDNPERQMAGLHSSYAWGAVGVILLSSLFLIVFDNAYWWILSLLLTIVPICSFFLFIGAKIPEMNNEKKENSSGGYMKTGTLWLFVFAIFLGGAAECTMSQWCSGYLESALGIPKAIGDIFGVMLFAIMLGIGRTLYTKRGKKIEKTLLISAIGTSICYFAATFSPFAVVGLIAAALTGLFTAMLWPGTLIAAEKKFPLGGVFLFAILASGGDLGAALIPQLVGIVTDAVSGSAFATRLSSSLSMTSEQLGMRVGMLFATLFTLIAIVIFYTIYRTRNKEDMNNENQSS